MKYALMESPIGLLTLVSGDQGLEEVAFGRKIPAGALRDLKANAIVAAQLGEYFEGNRQSFDLPLVLRGTPFQQMVWRALREIPYGETRGYGQIARAIGKPRAARAVGMANHENPISIIVPCHRVIGHDGSLVGYGGGLDIKTALLKLEGALTTKEPKATRVRGRSTAPQPVLFS